MSTHNRLDYWEKNIAGFSGFYNKNSEETLHGNKLLTFFYKKFLFPIEKKYMLDRYNFVINFINENSSSNKVWADIGCGSGVFTSILANKNLKVFALDFAESSLNLTSDSLESNLCTNFELLKLDLSQQHIPTVDFAIAIGIVPYIKDMDVFLNNVLPYTNKVYFNFLDADNFLNKLRGLFSVLDVRGYFYHSLTDIEKFALKHGFKITSSDKLATGYMLELTKK